MRVGCRSCEVERARSWRLESTLGDAWSTTYVAGVQSTPAESVTSNVRWNDAGLVPVIAQSELGGEVRMLAWANQEALTQTLQTSEAHFFSRSREKLWKKGESSGNILRVQSVWLDCDGDTLIYLVDPTGPSCHTGARTCFFTRLQSEPGPDANADEEQDVALPFAGRLLRTLEERSEDGDSSSYTKKLLRAGVPKVVEKIREEAEELCVALEGEDDSRVASEAADLMYHAVVGLMSRNIDPESVLEVLRQRFGVSGLVEKASRHS